MLFQGIYIFVALIQHCTTQTSAKWYNGDVIVVDHGGNSSLVCCVNGSCPCSNLSLALQHAHSTEIKITSNISFPDVMQLSKTVYSVNITGIGNPRIQCDGLGGLVVKNGNRIAIEGITLEKCVLMIIYNFTEARIVNCGFVYSVGFSLMLNYTSAITLDNTRFEQNSAGVFIYNAAHVNIHECHFTANGQTIKWTDSTGTDVNAHAGPALLCNLVSALQLSYTTFTSNSNSAVVLKSSTVTITGNNTFCNNIARATTIVNKEISSVRILNESNTAPEHTHSNKIRSTPTLLTNDEVFENGGALLLISSTLSIWQGNVVFYNNTASNGGAIYISNDSNFYVNESYLEFSYNIALLYGGAVYIKTDASFISHYYTLLNDIIIHAQNNTNIAYSRGNYAYFAFSDLVQCHSNRLLQNNHLFASSLCSVVEEFNNAALKVNKSNYNHGSVLFQLLDLKLDLVAMDYFGHDIIPFNGSLICRETNCKGYISSCQERGYKNHFKYSIQSVDGSPKLVFDNVSTKVCCCLSSFNSKIIVLDTPTQNLTSNTFQVNVLWRIPPENCANDTAHYIHNDECIETSCNNLLRYLHQDLPTGFPPGLGCPNGYIMATPSYWYDNGFKSYVVSCPGHYCNLSNWYNKILPQPFPDRDLQCNGNWGGFACGECNYSANYHIKYGTTDCVPKDKCLKPSLKYNLILWIGISFVYWIAVISFIFVLLQHLKFDIKTGYAYGIIFYYSVLEQIVTVFNDVVKTENCGYTNNKYFYKCFHSQHDHEFVSKVIPFLSAIGRLKIPFMQYMKICLNGTEMIDHIFLSYLHPLIVVFIVTALFLSNRRFVVVGRFVGQYIKSESICLLILLSYSSVSHTSFQLLRLLPYFELTPHGYSGVLKGWRTYWSPAMHYFHGRHMVYATVAIICEVVIGFGLPAFLLLRRHITRRFGVNFMTIKTILDQLEGCYGKGYYRFVSFYLICRQVIYGTDILIAFETFLWTDHISVKLVAMLIICITIVVIHLWFQPYRQPELNVLDCGILLTLIALLVCSVDGRNYGIAVVFWVLPLLFLLNYLTYMYYKKARHVIAMCSIIGVIILANVLVFLSSNAQFYYMSFVSILCQFLSITVFVIYATTMVRYIYAKCCRQEQDDLNLQPDQHNDASITDDDSQKTESSNGSL